MCGRTGLSLCRDAVCCACSYKPKGSDSYVKPDWIDEHNDGKQYTPSHNIAPTDVTPILVSSSKFRKCDGKGRVLKPMMWGIIPPWKKDSYSNHNLSTNNCRLENINTSKLYYPVLRDGGRCIIVVEGFYEWQTTDKQSKAKQPYYIYSEQENGIEVDEPDTWHNDFSDEAGWKGIRLLHIAGLYSMWQSDDTTIYSYSVITMNSNNTLDWLHHRMPAILESQEQIEAWLDVDNVKSDMALSYLTPAKILKWHPVSSKVNNSRYKSSDSNKRTTVDKKQSSAQRTLSSWFVKTEKRKSGDGGDTADCKRVKKESGKT